VKWPDLPRIGGYFRLGLWLPLLAITILIFLYPTRMTFQPGAIESIQIFQDLPLFGGLYYLFMALLFLLLFSRGKFGNGDGENIALLCFFAVVFAGFWASLTRGYSGEPFLTAADVKHNLERGYFTVSLLSYGGWPGLSIVGTYLAQATGLKTFDIITVLMFFQILLFPVLGYILFRRSLKNPYFALLAVLLVIEGNMVISLHLTHIISRSFASILLFTTLLVVLGRHEFSRRWPENLISVALILAITITHFVTSVALFLVMLGLYFTQRLGKERLIAWPFLIVSAVVPIIWLLLYVPSVLQYLTGLVPHAVEIWTKGNILSKLGLLIGTSSYSAERTPLWATLCLYFWHLFTIVLGFILGLKCLFAIKNLNTTQKKEIGGLIGIGLLCLAIFFIAGLEEAYGFTLAYISVFAIPIILGFLVNLKDLFRKTSLAVIVTLLLVLALPTFLAYNAGISTTSYYPHDLASCEFLGRAIKEDEDLHLYGVGTSYHPVHYYVPNTFEFTAYYPSFRGEGEGGLWRMIDEEIITPFDSSKDKRWISVLEVSPRWVLPFEKFFGIDPETRPQWAEVQARLSQENKIYDNGYVQLYQK
jgi:hypothetical protein